MPSPNYFKQVIQTIEDRGMGQREIAKQLRISQSAVSHIKAGDGFPADEKLAILEQLSGGKFSAREMFLAKVAIWLDAKGVEPAEIEAFRAKQMN